MQVDNKNVPLKEFSNKEIKRKKKHWINEGIITSIHKRNSYIKKFRKTDDFPLSDTNAWIQSKNDYYCKHLNKDSENIRKMWQQINKTVHT